MFRLIAWESLARFRARADSIYDKIGGHEALEVVVEDFYCRVLADDHLAGFFAGTNMNGAKASRSSSSPPRSAGPSPTPARR